ncbi:MAG: tetratricopeptide repeat protein [Deltaproteobacteria bacterium]|nr:tetratricopeptide repeat protein [Deltaproteobacteria bacterium]
MIFSESDWGSGPGDDVNRCQGLVDQVAQPPADAARPFDCAGILRMTSPADPAQIAAAREGQAAQRAVPVPGRPTYIPQDRPWTPEAYLELANDYFQQTKYYEAITLYRLFLALYPLHFQAPRGGAEHRDLIRAPASLRPGDRRPRRPRALHRGQRVVERQQQPPRRPALRRHGRAQLAARHGAPAPPGQLRQRGRELAVAATRQTGAEQAQSQADALDRLRQADVEYQAAVRAYTQFIENYPNDEAAYEFRYNRADALFWSRNYQEASRAYSDVRESNENDQFLVASAYMAVKSQEAFIRLQAQRRAFDPCLAIRAGIPARSSDDQGHPRLRRRGEATTCAAATGDRRGTVTELNIPEPVRQLMDARIAYANRVPQTSTTPRRCATWCRSTTSTRRTTRRTARSSRTSTRAPSCASATLARPRLSTGPSSRLYCQDRRWPARPSTTSTTSSCRRAARTTSSARPRAAASGPAPGRRRRARPDGDPHRPPVPSRAGALPRGRAGQREPVGGDLRRRAAADGRGRARQPRPPPGGAGDDTTSRRRTSAPGASTRRRRPTAHHPGLQQHPQRAGQELTGDELQQRINILDESNFRAGQNLERIFDYDNAIRYYNNVDRTRASPGGGPRGHVHDALASIALINTNLARWDAGRGPGAPSPRAQAGQERAGGRVPRGADPLPAANWAEALTSLQDYLRRTPTSADTAQFQGAGAVLHRAPHQRLGNDRNYRRPCARSSRCSAARASSRARPRRRGRRRRCSVTSTIRSTSSRRCSSSAATRRRCVSRSIASRSSCAPSTPRPARSCRSAAASTPSAR